MNNAVQTIQLLYWLCGVTLIKHNSICEIGSAIKTYTEVTYTMTQYTQKRGWQTAGRLPITGKRLVINLDENTDSVVDT